MSRNRTWNLTVRGDYIGTAKTENSKRDPVRLSEELKEKQVTASQGVRHFANLHCTGVSSRLAFAHHPPVILQSHRVLCSAQRVAQAYQRLQIHLHRAGAPCLICHEGQAAKHSSILRWEAMCCTVINHSNQEHHRNNKKTELCEVHVASHLRMELFCCMCKCKEKEGLASRNGQNTERFVVPTVSIGYWGVGDYNNAVDWRGCAFYTTGSTLVGSIKDRWGKS